MKVKEMYIAGLMSGTSADGVDAALINVKGFGMNTHYDLIDFIMLPYPDKVRERIFEAMDLSLSNAGLLCSLNFELGNCFAKAVTELCRHADFSLEDLDLIGSHGQTVFHIPERIADYVPSTLQLGEPAVIAFQTQTPVVANFRVMDMAAGGQGAPLIAYIDYLLFGHSGRAAGLLNIGGISNITVLPENGNLENVSAFDTGPGNMIIDGLVQKLYGEHFDQDGRYAKRGRICTSLLNQLLDDPYIRNPPPKTTGREKYGSQFVDQIMNKGQGLCAEDLIATATRFTVLSIVQNVQSFIQPYESLQKVMVSGGGSHNPVLMASLKKFLPGVEVTVFESSQFKADAKEAVAFAILANEWMHRIPANVPCATGASHRMVLGNYTPFICQAEHSGDDTCEL